MERLQTRTRDLDRSALGARRLDFDAIPVIDIAALLNGGPGARAEVARRIDDACRNVGFFYVAIHGVPQRLLDAVYREVRDGLMARIKARFVPAPPPVV